MITVTHIIKKGEILPKTKKFGCVGRGDMTLLLFSKVVKWMKVRGDLSTNVEDNKSFTSRPSDLQNYALPLVLCTFKNNKSIYVMDNGETI